MYDDTFYNELGQRLKSCLGQALSATNALNGIPLPTQNGAELPSILHHGLQKAYRITEKYLQLRQFAALELLPAPELVQPAVMAHVHVAEGLWLHKKINLNSYVEDGVQLRLPLHLLSFIVVELLDNACRFAPEQGAVRLSILDTGTDVVLEVENPMAHTLTADEMTQVGTPFFRGTNAGEEIGAGLSLSCLEVAASTLGFEVQHSQNQGQWRTLVRFKGAGQNAEKRGGRSFLGLLGRNAARASE